jgi:hypothetical protein
MTRVLHLCALTTCSAAALSAQSHLVKPVIDTLDHHVVRVMNNGPTAWTDTNGWKLVYERTVQPAESDPQGFGDISNIAMQSNGRLIEAETAHPVVRMFGADGRFIRTIGRDGEGPGEYRNPYVMVYHDTIVVQDQQLRRATVYDPDGKLMRSFPSTCCAFGMKHWIDDHGHLIATGMRNWAVFDLAGKQLDSLEPPDAGSSHRWVVRNPNGQPSISVMVPFTGHSISMPLRNGTVIYGATDRYQLLITTNGRDTVRIFGRSGLVPQPVRPGARDSMYQAVIKQIEALRGIAHESDIPSVGPLWDDVMQDDAGNIWITRSVGAKGLMQADVFTPDGKYLGAVATPFLSRGGIDAWSRDHLAVVDTDDNDLPRVRIFRIERNSRSARRVRP